MKRTNKVENRFFTKSKKGQITIFVIIALVIVAGIAGYFILKDRIGISKVPAEFQGVYDYYLSCIESETEDGLSLLGTQGGYIELPEFEPGSEYAPFSSQLDFLGFGVPYWYYVSQNGLIKEQMPSLSDMQNDLDSYLEEKILECDFSDFRREGYDITLGSTTRVNSKINEQTVDVNVAQSLSISKGGGEDQRNVIVTNHNLETSSKLGKFYDIAKEIYTRQAEEMILENYAFDILNLYAPVSGTEISCSPLIWNPYNVVDDLQKGLNANLQMIRVQGEYYDSNEVNDYYIIDAGLNLKDEQVNFMYNPEWPSRFEIWPTKNNLMISESVGPSQGLSVAGFCYVSYKYIYDMYFPVLIQIGSLEDPESIFQFPVAVVISKNQLREALNVEPIYEEDELNICDNSNVDVSIYTYNVNLDPVEANVSYQCFTDVCYLGQTVDENGEARLDTKVPACSNGIITANAENYKETTYSFSSNQESIADVVMDKAYELQLEVYVDGKITNNLAVLTITENSEEQTGIETLAYPQSRSLKLSEGDYTFDLKVFTNKQLTLPESSEQKCVEVPRSGVLGVFGLKEDKCYDYVIPSQTLSTLLYAGGTQDYYITPSELNEAKKLRVYATSIDIPTKIEDLQKTYDLIDVKNLEISIL